MSKKRKRLVEQLHLLELTLATNNRRRKAVEKTLIESVDIMPEWSSYKYYGLGVRDINKAQLLKTSRIKKPLDALHKETQKRIKKQIKILKEKLKKCKHKQSRVVEDDSASYGDCDNSPPRAFCEQCSKLLDEGWHLQGLNY